MRPVNIPIPDDLVPAMAAHLISQVGAVTPPAKAVVDAVGRALLEDLEPDGDLSAALVPVDSVAASRRRWPGRTVHIECETLDQVRESLEAGADALLLDNMTPAQIAARTSSSTTRSTGPPGSSWRRRWRGT